MQGLSFIVELQEATDTAGLEVFSNKPSIADSIGFFPIVSMGERGIQYDLNSISKILFLDTT